MFDTANLITLKRLLHLRDSFFTTRRPCDQLGDHRVIEHRDFATGIDAGIHSRVRAIVVSAATGVVVGFGMVGRGSLVMADTTG